MGHKVPNGMLQLGFLHLPMSKSWAIPGVGDEATCRLSLGTHGDIEFTGNSTEATVLLQFVIPIPRN